MNSTDATAEAWSARIISGFRRSKLHLSWVALVQALSKFSRFSSQVVRWVSLWSRIPNLVKFRIHAPVLLEDSQRETLTWQIVNLEHRMDRRQQSQVEFERLGLDTHFVRAVERKNGALGCAESHLKVLSNALAQRPGDLLAVAEDDLQFVEDRGTLDALIAEFLLHPSLDVMCISNRVTGPSFPISGRLNGSAGVLTTACYIAKPRALETLVRVAEKSVQLLSNGVHLKHGAIDVVWQEAQLTDLLFATPRTRAARQRASFSNVANKFADYGDSAGR